MHEHVTCKTNCIMGLAQSKPISTQTSSTHLNASQYCYNANVMQCMRFQTHLSENPSQNFKNNSSILKKPQNFSKTPKPKFQNMKCMKNKRLETYQEKKNLEKA